MSYAHNGTASATERTIKCASSLVLPRVRRTRQESERGSGIHGFVASVLSGTPIASALKLVDEQYRGVCDRIDWRGLGGDLRDVRTEVAYALDPIARSARELGANLGRHYGPLGANEVPGSLDIEGVSTFDGTPVVIDLKSGWLDVTEAEENGQGLFFGAVKALMTGAPEVEFRIAKLLPSGRIVPDVARYSALDLDSFLDEYESAIGRVRKAREVYESGGVPNVVTGEWCRWCECLESCPAYSALARSMLGDALDIEQRIASLSLAQAGAAWRKAKQIDVVLTRVLDGLKARAKQVALPLGDGKEARAISYSKQSFDKELALELLRDKGASSDEIAALYRSVNVEQVREANVPGAKARPRKEKAA